jgi:CSLREA domain-containing protein
VLALVLVVAFASLPAPAVYAASAINVNTTADENGSGANCSLREAITSANTNFNFGGCTDAAGGPFTINVPAGTYSLTAGELQVGTSSGANITISGAGSGNTIIHQSTANSRIFNLDPSMVGNVAVSISGVTISGGFAQAFGGGAILGGGTNDTLLLTNAVITDNHCSGSFSGAGISWSPAGNATISNTTFSNNTCASGGAGAILYTTGDGSALTIISSTFSGNTAGATGSAGGALLLGGNGGSPTVIINGSTFTNNQATHASGIGGAIYVGGGTLNLGNSAANRFVGNTAGVSASGGLGVRGGTANATNNWWGCNGGAGVGTGCDKADNSGGTLNFNPWIVLTNTPSPNPIITGQSSTLTASLLQNSAGTPISVGNLGVLIGLPISFGNPVLGTISGAQATIQSNGTATATFTANAAGAGHADATVDNGTATANITINRPPTTITSINRATSSPTNAGSVAWTVVFANAVSGLTASNFTLANSGLGGASTITAVSPLGGAPATSWTITASTGSGDGTLGLNLANDTGLDYALSNLPFTGQIYTIDRTAPTVTINQAAGQADPTDSVPINFTVVFSEPVTGFTSADVTLSGTAGANTALVTGSGTTYNIAVSGITNIGTVIASIPANVVSDAAGNGSTASTSADNSVTVPVIPKWHVYVPLIRAL